MRYLPQWVLAGTALVSVAVVAMVYLFNPPVHRPEPASFAAGVAAVEAPPEPKPAEAVEVAATSVTPLDDEVAQLKRSMDGAVAAPAANASLAAVAPLDLPSRAGTDDR